MRGCSVSIQALTSCSREFILSPQRALSKPLNLYTFSSFRAKQTGVVCAQAAYICLLREARLFQETAPPCALLCHPSSINLNKSYRLSSCSLLYHKRQALISLANFITGDI